MSSSSHSRAALSSRCSVMCVTFSWLLESLWKMYFPWLLESLESPSECDAPHIVIFLTWLLESPSECEIAHMVPRARTLVPISESETKLTYQVPGFSQHRRCVIARGRLRGHPAPPAFGVAPSGFEIAPLRARRSGGLGGAVCGALRALLGPLRGVCGHGKAPAGAGAFGSAFEVFQDVCQVCGVVAAEFLEEVDLDIHWGSLSLFPLVVPPFYQPPPPVSSPSSVSFATFLSTIRHGNLPRSNLR